jgi:hypothetical protein
MMSRSGDKPAADDARALLSLTLDTCNLRQKRSSQRLDTCIRSLLRELQQMLADTDDAIVALTRLQQFQMQRRE